MLKVGLAGFSERNASGGSFEKPNAETLLQILYAAGNYGGIASKSPAGRVERSAFGNGDKSRQTFHVREKV